MSRHLADKRASSNGGRMKQFLRIGHEGGGRIWDMLRQRPAAAPAANRRVAEFLRIARGRLV
ncbi:MAG: hypothetical protein LBE86_10940 [Gemmobacter sp.]|jgi:hypothetical protein|nr:hypothetical protein [Gemmobacter sp.]